MTRLRRATLDLFHDIALWNVRAAARLEVAALERKMQCTRFDQTNPSHVALHARLRRIRAFAYALEHECKYSQDQPRVPAGNSDGGQWTSDGGGGGDGTDFSGIANGFGQYLAESWGALSSGIAKLPAAIGQVESDLYDNPSEGLNELFGPGGYLGWIPGEAGLGNLMAAGATAEEEATALSAANALQDAATGADVVSSLPKPEGIPDDWLEGPTGRPGSETGGVRYYDPENPTSDVRIMPGNPNASYSSQQIPYVRWRLDRDNLNIEGKVVPEKSSDSHIPLTDFTFDPKLYK